MKEKKLNFGCGIDYREGWDNIDVSETDEYGTKIKVEKFFNFDVFPYPIKDNTYDYILLNQVLEHVFYPEKVMKELIRISKNNGIIDIRVPHFADFQAFLNPTHKKYYALDSIEFMKYDCEVIKKELEYSQQPIIRQLAQLVTISPFIWERFLRGYFPLVRGCHWTLKVRK